MPRIAVLVYAKLYSCEKAAADAHVAVDLLEPLLAQR